MTGTLFNIDIQGKNNIKLKDKWEEVDSGTTLRKRISGEMQFRYNNKITYRDDGTMWKKHDWYSQYKIIFPILKKYKLDFIPKIIKWNDLGYRYEYVDGFTISDNFKKENYLNQKMILEIKIAWDDICKKLYQISIENFDDEFLWFNDPSIGNLIWKDDSKELILLDLDSFCIGEYVPISYINNIMTQQLETNMLVSKFL